MPKLRITLDLTEDQLASLLATLEGVMNGALPGDSPVFRGPEFAATALGASPNEFSYEINQLAPIYLQLVRLWPHPNTPAAFVHSPAHQIYFGHEGVLAG